jgi:hypothetical protein
MKLFTSIFVLFLALGLFRVPVFAAVVLNEILPKSEDVQNEYIELYNTGSETVSLNGWTLTNTTGTVKTFIMGASPRIDPHGYVLFRQSQMGIIFSKDGDTIRLTDEKNTLVDSQSYPGTLGFNTSMGRSPDGGQSWSVCNSYTPDLPNDCPMATPSPTVTPTAQITNTPIPTDTEIPVPTENQQSRSTPVYQPPGTNAILGVAVVNTPTSTPLPSDLVKISIPPAIIISKTIILQVIIVIGAWLLLVLFAAARRKRKKIK